MHFRLVVFAVALSLMQNGAGQAATGDTTETGVVLSRLSEPVYPPIARIAHIVGDVEVKLGIRMDGSIESAVAIGGHPLLKQSALESAQQSRFECRGCGDEVTYYSLTYTFQDATGPPKPNESRNFEVVQSQNRVTIFAQPRPIHIYFVNVRVRAVKCLYLWGCGSRWGGEDYYYYRVRSAQCLYLWRCGLHRRDPPAP
ncbi:MAG: outer rane transport energization protein TonB [Candidatus Angelobacter sp.]|nr:outer rane transport energization protein TonB [Candidatus Angelobacter sp.]